ncbi:predicted protein [Aspergillus nidulans FGSC A4]|uniref:Thioesterase domain-containing protein n=1 Tax=Emericella nidulans (strain FGSC A4 / ATCC 38163 / CBS 112.46 / NRRL 194 / M139) TaxID=227321 RepID=Q5AU10_EMENI|nr:hypothetical protein [Aspergillus nidulans FGSC A4]EAA58876.1 predicted protein [Aspergillus nidulans FGSC A4]CBF74140.1 TPA: hypothetical protein ANIA_08220 [Aspergillus nidulans FGSC A4]|eukprot:XP_681489.1 predicted protein [Aspergillus nidulans FGSC A4]
MYAHSTTRSTRNSSTPYCINTWLFNEYGMDPFPHNEVMSGPLRHPLPVKVPASRSPLWLTHMRYFASVGFPDVLELGLCVVSLGNSSLVYEAGVFKDHDEQVKILKGSLLRPFLWNGWYFGGIFTSALEQSASI